MNGYKSKKLWDLYCKDQGVEMNYFDKGRHRAYTVQSKVRCYMSDEILLDNYYLWCEKQLDNVTIYIGV